MSEQPMMTSQARTIRAVFADATDGYTAVHRLRGTGFRIDLAGAIDGDLIVTIEANRARFDELAVLVAAHNGRIDTEQRVLARLPGFQPEAPVARHTL
jgi:hypothetical protein